MAVSGMFRNGTLTTPVKTRSTFYPAFLDRLFAKPTASDAARTLSQHRVTKDRARIRARCDEMARQLGRAPIEWGQA